MIQCVAHIYNPDMTLTFDLKVKYIGFFTCIHVWPIPFPRFDICLPNLTHGCNTVRRCVAYIHDPNTTLIFDLKVKFTGFLDMFLCPIHNYFLFDIGLPYLSHASITMRGCVTYIYDPDSTLTFDLKVKFRSFCHVSVSDPSLLFALTLAYLIWHMGLSP